MSTRYFLIFMFPLLLNGCAGTNSGETGIARAARAELREEQPAMPGGASVSRPVYPSGSKRLDQPDVLSANNRGCSGEAFLLSDLAAKTVALSNRDVNSAVHLLQTMGYRTIRYDDAATDGMLGVIGGTSLYTCNDLPLIVVPQPPDESELIIGSGRDPLSGAAGPGGFATGIAGVGSNLQVVPLRYAHSADLDQVIVFYHESQQYKLARFEELLRNVVDAASPQVYIETMVLEVSEEVSKELGIAYQTRNIGDNSLLELGSLAVGDGPTVSYDRNTLRDPDGEYEFVSGSGIQAQVNALVDKGEAEVLARPSVLALSNRQAVIQIVDVIQSPVVQSSIGTTGELVVSAYSFEPLLLGITLNLRPRVSADRDWVSLEIDATVESEIDENSGAVFAPDGEGGVVQLAEKKGSAARKVKTFARIPDRTPIVIGGLVAGNQERQRSRIPVLGEIPGLGALFGATDNEMQKREIVIVLTPHVLAEDAIGVRANLANDAVMERQKNLKLFNNVYQMSDADVFDMNFLLEDERFATYRDRALGILNLSPDRYADPVLSYFGQGRIPGDEVLVRKMIFDIAVANLGDFEPDTTQMYLPVRNREGNRQLVPMAEVLRPLESDESGDVVQIEWFRDLDGDLFYRYRTVPLAEARANRGENVLTLHDERDRQRLLASIAADVVIRRNGGFAALNLATLKDGTLLSLANPYDFDGYVLSEDTTRIFGNSKNVLESFRFELERAYRHIDSAGSD